MRGVWPKKPHKLPNTDGYDLITVEGEQNVTQAVKHEIHKLAERNGY